MQESEFVYKESQRNDNKNHFLKRQTLFIVPFFPFSVLFFPSKYKAGEKTKSQILNPLFQGSAHYGPPAVFVVLLEHSHAH